MSDQDSTNSSGPINPLRALALSLQRMPPALMLLIIVGLSVAVTITVVSLLDRTSVDTWNKTAHAHSALHCPKCHGLMTAGTLSSIGSWSPGCSATRRDGDGVVTFSCDQCGYLESYSK